MNEEKQLIILSINGITQELAYHIAKTLEREAPEYKWLIVNKKMDGMSRKELVDILKDT